MDKHKDTYLLCDDANIETANVVDTPTASNKDTLENTKYDIHITRNSIIADIIDTISIVREFCENNKGITAGLVFIFFLLILIIATERDCRKSISLR